MYTSDFLIAIVRSCGRLGKLCILCSPVPGHTCSIFCSMFCCAGTICCTDTIFCYAGTMLCWTAPCSAGQAPCSAAQAPYPAIYTVPLLFWYCKYSNFSRTNATSVLLAMHTLENAKCSKNMCMLSTCRFAITKGREHSSHAPFYNTGHAVLLRTWCFRPRKHCFCFIGSVVATQALLSDTQALISASEALHLLCCLLHALCICRKRCAAFVKIKYI